MRMINITLMTELSHHSVRISFVKMEHICDHTERNVIWSVLPRILS